MNIIGRKKELDTLTQCLSSKRPVFLVLYGRRRVGKTYLIREYFNHRFAFYATGVEQEKTAGQLKAFQNSLVEYGDTERGLPKDWFEAFRRLRKLLSREDVQRDPASGRMVVFLDELPWMDTARSDFRSALDYFWNSWGSAQQDLTLITCGSATSWMINHLLQSTGGFYNRVTHQIHLQPFSLTDCERYFASDKIPFTRQQIMEFYMVFGGIPHYMNCIDRRLSLAQNIDELLLNPTGQLYHEYERLFLSLFKNAQKHLAIVETLAMKRSGMTRVELSDREEIGDGEPLTRALSELEQCGFIRKYHHLDKKKNGGFFQLIDPFVLFYLQVCRDRATSSWMHYIGTPGYYAWRGYAFEILCLNHIPQMKQTLGISGVSSEAYAWRSYRTEPGAQIDLLIDRKDGVINLCEMKYTDEPYSMTAEEHEKLIHRLEAFRMETKTNKAIMITLIAAAGVKRGMYTDTAAVILTGDDFFAGPPA